jgi:CRISPR/Cas system-associated endonuclease/helicase Cas3
MDLGGIGVSGAGKTRGALLPFIYAKQQRLGFADRLISALPQRTLRRSAS